MDSNRKESALQSAKTLWEKRLKAYDFSVVIEEGQTVIKHDKNILPSISRLLDYLKVNNTDIKSLENSKGKLTITFKDKEEIW